MPRYATTAATLSLAALVLACNGSEPSGDLPPDLLSDLNEATTVGLELAALPSDSQVIAAELLRMSTPRPSAPRRPAPAPRPVAPVEDEVIAEVEAPVASEDGDVVALAPEETAEEVAPAPAMEPLPVSYPAPANGDGPMIIISDGPQPGGGGGVIIRGGGVGEDRCEIHDRRGRRGRGGVITRRGGIIGGTVTRPITPRVPNTGTPRVRMPGSVNPETSGRTARGGSQ